MAKNKIIFIVFFISFFAINSQDSEKIKNIRVLNYYDKDGKIYSIEEYEDNFKIITKEIVDCVMEPCILPTLDEKTIENEEDCKKFKKLLDEIFQDSDDKEKTLKSGGLTSAQKRIIFNILDNNKINTPLEYEIIKNTNVYKMKYEKRGYIYEIEDDESVVYTIAMGQMPSTGYSIEIKKVKIKGNNASIFVTEKVPPKNVGEDTVLTYPVVQVKFNHIPSSVEVINYETEESYPCLN